ncbi:unnamed protein product [Cuscuta campestris]|uniref:Uncharacterized protein n=1 Tax=Cuscuta campestris TaxID=132261 RepID=A0A484M1F6_9ASTE|nr:unnamed protein product [Cuscuta campestris]
MVVCWCNLQIKVIVGIIGLLFMGKLLEPMREFMREFLKFIFIVKFPTPVCIFITTILLYYIQDMKTTCNSCKLCIILYMA